MQPEHRLGVRILQRPLLHHQRRAAFFTLGRAFFGRLEEEFDRAGDLVAHAGQDFRHAEEDGHVRVVPAGVHHADFLPVVGRLHRRLERHVDLLDHRQRVHVRAQRHYASRLAALEDADYAGVRDGRLHLDAERFEAIGDQLRGAELAVAELGMLVDVAAALDDLRLDGGGRGIKPLVESGGGEGGGHQDHSEEDFQRAFPCVIVPRSASALSSNSANHSAKCGSPFSSASRRVRSAISMN